MDYCDRQHNNSTWIIKILTVGMILKIDVKFVMPFDGLSIDTIPLKYQKNILKHFVTFFRFPS